jgi:competence protein ComEC
VHSHLVYQNFQIYVCLIAFYEKYAGALHRFLNRGGPLRIVWLYIGGVLVADLVASMATLPFAIYHFNRIALFTTYRTTERWETSS